MLGFQKIPMHLIKFLCKTSKFYSSVQSIAHAMKQPVCFEGIINPSHVINSNTIFRELSADKKMYAYFI